MKLIYLSSACVLVEHEGVKILCDPWLVDGAYYGSWYHYPPLKFKPEDFNDVDYIYISHIHPDHFDPKTLKRMNRNIPVLILNYTSKFLKKNIESLGFKVTELNHNERVHLKNSLYINLLAADNCNPQLCAKFIGCGVMETKFGATHIDSLCVIDNNKEVIVNVNDCPWELAHSAALAIKNQYDNIDLLLVGYSGAGAYPQCFEMSDEEKEIEAKNKIEKFLIHGVNYVNLFKPKYYLPFAGKYILGGRLHALNQHRGNPELEEAYSFFTTTPAIDQNKHQCIILNQGEFFDTSTENGSSLYVPINLEEKNQYIQTISQNTYDYDDIPEPSREELISMVPLCYKRFESMRQKIGFTSETTILIEISDEELLSISCNGKGYKVISKDELKNVEKYMMLSLDRRLLKLAMRGPPSVHWNNVELGSHIWHKKVPNDFERGLYYCMNFFNM